MSNLIDKKEFKIIAPFEVKSEESTGEILTLEGFANYMGEPDSNGYGTYSDLQDDTVQVKGIDLSIYKINPIVLLQHDKAQPIGKCVKIEKRKNGLWVRIEIYKDACDEKDFNRIKNEIIKSFSIGFMALKTELKETDSGNFVRYIMKSRLLEISCVSIPASSPSVYSFIKSIDGEGFYTEQVEDEETISNTNSDTTSNTKEELTMNIKLKRADLLTEADLDTFKSLGGNTEEEVEVGLSDFIKSIVAREVADILAAKESAQKEAEAKAQEEAEAKAQEEAELKAAEEAKLAAEAEAVKLEEAKELEAELVELKALIDELRSLATEEK